MSGLPDRFQKAEKEFTHRDQPRLSIYQGEGGHINAAAVRQVFDSQPEALFIGADSEMNELAFVPADRDAPDSYVFSSDDQGLGGDIRFGTTLEALGIDPDDFEETQYVELERLDGIVVADLSDLKDSATEPGAADSTDAVGDESDGWVSRFDALSLNGDQSSAGRLRALLDRDIGDDPLETTCGELGDAIDVDGRQLVHDLKALDEYAIERTERETETGASIWRIERLETDDAAQEFEDRIAARTTEGDLSPTVVHNAAERVESVQALAETLDVSVGRARSQVHELDIDLNDKVSRPGVDR